MLGYYTLSAIAVEHADLPGKVRRNAPHPIPAVLMGRLAIDTNAHGSGLGRFLVRDAILSTLAAADRIGVRSLLVHALPEEAATFYENLGFKRGHAGALFAPPPTRSTCTSCSQTPGSHSPVEPLLARPPAGTREWWAEQTMPVGGKDRVDADLVGQLDGALHGRFVRGLISVTGSHTPHSRRGTARRYPSPGSQRCVASRCGTRG
ncbi:MAG: GNAT family N-acetyltransferase [Beutenbergiaceae bacterium]